MNSAFEYLYLRRPVIDYICPGFCETDFSGSGSPIIILDPFGRIVSPSGLVLSGDGNLTLSWSPYPGALCFNIYQAADANNPDGEYVIIAECVEGNSFQLPEPGSYRVSAITPDGESELSASVTVEEGPAPPPPVSIWNGLIAYWAWENNLVDSTGNGHTLYDIPPVAFAAGKVNTGGSTAAFGDGRYGQDDAVFDFSGAAGSVFTFVGWYNASEVSPTHITNIFQYGNWGISADNLNFLGTFLDDGTFGGTNQQMVVPGVLPNVWFFIVVHYNGVTNTGYMEVNRANNAFLGLPCRLAGSPGSSGFIGNHVGAFSPAATAYLDEYAFWPRELTTAELDYLYNGGVGKTFNT